MNPNLVSTSRTTIPDVRGADLPVARAKQVGIQPEQVVDVVIQDRQAAMCRLTRLMGALGAEAEANGLTVEMLDRIVDE